MSTYYSIITNQGLINHAQAATNPEGLKLTYLAVGDGNGFYYEPVPTDTALRNELERFEIASVNIDPNNENQIIIEAVIDEIVGPFTIREVGVFYKENESDLESKLFAIGKYPETFKPDLPSGSGKKLYIRMILGFSSAPNVTLVSSDLNFAQINDELDNRLKVSENLADLDDIQVARDNLGLGSAALAGNASENSKGVAKIATQAEVNSGINDQDFITPKKFLDSFSESKSSAGYTMLPNGMIFQWGTGSGNDAGWKNVNLSVPFPNYFIYVNCVEMMNPRTGNSHINFNTDIDSLSTFRFESIAHVSRNMRWFAVGF
ncbi:MAG: hypothetical protein ACJAZX_000413 [Rickettsiales bacterium]|jgi:hypothetical protein